MWLLRTIFFVILLVFFVVIAVQNSTPDITVKFFAWTQTMPLWIVIFASALVGFVVGMVVSAVREIRLRLDSGKLRRERDEYQREIARLRAAPLDQLSSSPDEYSGGDSLP